MLRYLGNLRGGRWIHLKVKNTVEDGGKHGFNLHKHAEIACMMQVSKSLEYWAACTLSSIKKGLDLSI